MIYTGFDMNSVVKQIWHYREQLVADNMRRETPDVRNLVYDFIKTPVENFMYFRCITHTRSGVIDHADLYRL